MINVPETELADNMGVVAPFVKWWYLIVDVMHVLQQAHGDIPHEDQPLWAFKASRGMRLDGMRIEHV